MRIAGIIAEYNPFHRGHAYHIAQTRARLGEDCAVVCAMSGNWVQRGEAAITGKRARAEMALQGGADLVLELPTPWSTSSAEGFAQGGVAILAAAGVDTLSFGSEEGQLATLRQAAQCLNTQAYREQLGCLLDKRLSFAAARQAAVRALLGPGADCLSQPNSNLAVEYLRALPAGMEALAIPRMGVGHDGGLGAHIASASALRALLQAGQQAQAEAYMVGPFLGEVADLHACERAVLARLRTMTAAQFAALPHSGEGLAYRLQAAAYRGRSLEEVYDLAKTRRYAHARIRRMVLWAYLGLTAEDWPQSPPYLRVLGLNARGQAVLRQAKRACPLPILTKPTCARQLPEAGRRLFALEARCTDLFALCYPHLTQSAGGSEWRTGPVVVP